LEKFKPRDLYTGGGYQYRIQMIAAWADNYTASISDTFPEEEDGRVHTITKVADNVVDWVKGVVTAPFQFDLRFVKDK
tara:strand:- start:1848 stop:2081 length:234 start_codon:yes stop_codon:yes gene_type:complete